MLHVFYDVLDKTFDAEYKPSGNSKLLFHVGTNVLRLLFFFFFFVIVLLSCIFPSLTNRQVLNRNIFILAS